MTIGEALKTARAGIRQEDVADALGVEQGTISRWESGQSRPTFEQVSAFEDAVGRPRGWCWIAAGYVVMPATTRESIAADAALDPGYRDLVLSAYDSAAASSATDRQRTSATKPKAR